jgi:Flp pilus assembly protein TadG
MRRVTARRRPDEQGAIVVLMAAFTVVIVGVAALVVDVGAIHDEKRQLQNGADSAALDLAQYMATTCQAGAPACPPATLIARAQELANENARDGAASVTVTPDYPAKTVTVGTSTKAAGGGTILPYHFGRAATGVKGDTFSTKATASWAGLRTAPVVRLTISRCEFLAATAPNATVFNKPTTILFHKDSGINCPGGPSGANLPGGFGWLDDMTDGNVNDCVITPLATTEWSSDTGNSNPNPCHMQNFFDKDVLMALFDAVSGNGNNGSYHIYGFAQFHITGFTFPSGGSAGPPCGSNACLSGYFVRFVPVGELGGPTLGNRVALVS